MSKWTALVLSSFLGFSAMAAEEGLDTYKVDPSHTSVVFNVNHLGFSHVWGMITSVDGEIKWDEKKPENSSFLITADTNSITTQNAKRDEHLKKPDFFDAKQFPKITLKSTSVKPKGKNKYEVKAELNMHGVTKPVSFVFYRLRTGEGPMGKIRSGGDAQFSIKRSDFGMNYMQGENQLSDEVQVYISVEVIKQ